jgi:hypothetical protein
MIVPLRLLDDCKRLMGRLETDLIARSHGRDALPEVVEALRSEFQQAKDAKRTAQNFEDWRTEYATQQAAAWILSAVFVRFLEDNELIDPPRIAGQKERLQHARDQHELYFRAHPTETDREYLLHVFRDVGKLPGGREIFGKHTNVFELPQWLSGDAAGKILEFFQGVEANTGELTHDFTDSGWDTRFLGDLYQDLSEAARKKFALLQTPEFVEEFILDRTLDPALDEFGLIAFRMIDPACGSGHFVLGGFCRILDRWQRKEPGTNVRELVRRTIDSVNGVDINPYATAIARFRLLLEALRACNVRRLKDAPDFHINIATGDSLLHGVAAQGVLGFDELAHHYQAEDLDALRRILRPGAYHAVVANPPYITVKDQVLNQAYRERYTACHRQYSLVVPFMERIFGLAVPGGYTGQITANSFMKREFGKKLIEQFFPTIDLTHVLDTSGAYIPGHGTPTAILFGRNRRPVASTLRTVLGIRGEPQTPDVPAHGHVWSAILNQIDRPGSQSQFVSAGDSPRELFHAHPWSIGGGGAAELKEELERAAHSVFGAHTVVIGRGMHTGCDESYFSETRQWRRYAIEATQPLTEGDVVRDWRVSLRSDTIFPYDNDLKPIPDSFFSPTIRTLWLTKQFLIRRREPNGTHSEIGLTWYEWSRFQRERFRTPLSIVFAFVATHNHFVLDRGGKVFKQSAPVIKLPEGATEDDHLGLLGLLNSSVACFWMQQVFHNKGGPGGGSSKDEKWHDFYEHDGTKLKQFPLPRSKPLALSRDLDKLSYEAASQSPDSLLRDWGHVESDLRRKLERARLECERIRRKMVALQEELDWQCYSLYEVNTEDGLTWPDADLGNLPEIEAGQRAFEILLGRAKVQGAITTKWFSKLGITPIVDIPKFWPKAYQEVVENRISQIESSRKVGLIEDMRYKRRWEREPWEAQLERALTAWLLSRLESYFDFDGRMNDSGTPTAQRDITLCSVAQLADLARQDAKFMEAAELYTDDPAFDVVQLVTELVENESVPHLPVLRYKPSGLRKREEWEETWDLQRREDAIDARTKLPVDDPEYLSPNEADKLKRREVGEIAVPPKYTSADFLASHYWRLRGKLDVPKERWVSFPYCEGQDGTPTFAWAGNDHLQLARAISAHYVDVQERIGGRDDPRLVPLLASLIELLPWLKQWHNDVDPEFNMAMGDYFEGFIQEEARNLGMTLDEIRAWQPPQTTRRAPRRKKRAAR